MRASVIIPACTRWSSLQRCLDALLSQTFAPNEFEILVISDVARDNTDLARFASDPRVRFLQQSGQDVAAAMNSGIGIARGEIVILTGKNCFADPGFIAAHVRAHTSDENLVVQGPVLLDADCPRTAVTEFLRDRGQAEFIRLTAGDLRGSDLILGANSSMRRTILQQHLFDTAFRDNAAIEQAFRLRQAGVQVRSAPDAVVYHMPEKTPDQLISEAKERTAFEVTFSQSHPEYRAMSSIANWNRNPAGRRLIRSLVGRSVFSLAPLLKVLSVGINPLCRSASFLRLAHRLLKLRVEVAACRGAVSAAGSWTKLHASFLRRIPILMYHLVTSDSDSSPNTISMTRSTFAQQMQWLVRNGYQGIGISEFMAWRESNSPLPRHPVLITFDDAYDETAQNAFPILHRFGFPAACMVVTGEIASFNRWDVKLGWKPRQLMAEGALLEWQKRGIEYGAHSCSHPDLRALSESDLRRELSGSQKSLEQITGSRVRTFAYPYGCVDRRVKEETARFFDYAFTIESQPSSLAADAHLLGRMEPSASDSYFDFVSRVRWGWTPRVRLGAILDRRLGRILKFLGGAKREGGLRAHPDPES